MKKIKEDQFDPGKEYEIDAEFIQPEPHTCAQPNYTRKFDEILDYVIEEYEDDYFTVAQLEPLINRVMCQLYLGYWKNQLKSKLKMRLISQI